MKSSTASVGGFRLASLFEDLETSNFETSNILQKIQTAREEFFRLKMHLENYANQLR
jgi:hypothetical protein